MYLTGDGTGDGLLYVVERAGRIRVMTEAGKMRARCSTCADGSGVDGERGMHAVAFHPNFKKNGKFYVHYNTPAGNTRVVEYKQRKAGQEVVPGIRPDPVRLRPPGVEPQRWLARLRPGWLSVHRARRRRWQLAW